jgi:hypothetical protein
MSHQDPTRKAAAGTNAADLYKVFQWLTPIHCFQSIKFRSDCKWTPRLLAFAALLWSWSDFSKLGRRFEQALKIIRGLFKKQHVPNVSYQAFTKLLRRWTEPLLACLLKAYREKMQDKLSAGVARGPLAGVRRGWQSYQSAAHALERSALLAKVEALAKSSAAAQAAAPEATAQTSARRTSERAANLAHGVVARRLWLAVGLANGRFRLPTAANATICASC